jgi:hypothetical protein
MLDRDRLRLSIRLACTNCKISMHDIYISANTSSQACRRLAKAHMAEICLSGTHPGVIAVVLS